MTRRPPVGRYLHEPTASRPRLDARFSDEDAAATPWEEGRDRLARAPIYWLTTVRKDGRPHMTPLIGVWLDDAMHVCTGVDEQQGPQPRRPTRSAS